MPSTTLAALGASCELGRAAAAPSADVRMPVEASTASADQKKDFFREGVSRGIMCTRSALTVLDLSRPVPTHRVANGRWCLIGLGQTSSTSRRKSGRTHELWGKAVEEGRHYQIKARTFSPNSKPWLESNPQDVLVRTKNR